MSSKINNFLFANLFHYSLIIYILSNPKQSYISDALTFVPQGDPKCENPWYIALTKEMKLSWTGEDRDATVAANITTKDTYGRSCDNNVMTKAEFNSRNIALSNPCSNAHYTVAVTVICGSKSQKQNLTIRTPPDGEYNSILYPTRTNYIRVQLE